MIEAQDIKVWLGRREILHGVDFHAHAGRLTAIVGPNGSGKTTLMRAMTGDVAYTGQIAFEGRDMAAYSGWELASRRAVLPQATRIAFPFTVFEVVRLGLMSAATPDPATVSEALAKVGLQGFEGRFYHELSGGEQQRTQLARVLVQVWEPVMDGAPRWLFLDEPVASLDLGHQLEVMELAQDFARRGGGVVAVMHDLNLTAMHADSIALMIEGRLDVQGSAEEVLTDARLSRAYGCAVRVSRAPEGTAVPFVLPHVAALHG